MAVGVGCRWPEVVFRQVTETHLHVYMQLFAGNETLLAYAAGSTGWNADSKAERRAPQALGGLQSAQGE